MFSFFLFLYPRQYRKQFGREMYLLFYDLYEEELRKKGKVGIGFWVLHFSDVMQSVIVQHIDMIRKKGMKKYLQQTLSINKFNILGGVLLLPSTIVIFIDIVSRILQGDVMHYNRPVYQFLSHTPLYWYPVLFTWVILFPILAIALNVIPLVNNIRKHHFVARAFIKRNIVSIGLLVIALGFLMIIKLHDFIPCMIHGLLKVGFTMFPQVLSVCRRA